MDQATKTTDRPGSHARPRVLALSRYLGVLAMRRERLDLLYVTLFPASPARYGAQRRLEGVMASLARRHSVTAVSLITPDLDLARQMATTSDGFARRLHNTVNWRKVRREELGAWRDLDGVTFTSSPDEARARALVPAVRSAVIPNAADVAFFRPRPDDPPA